MSTRLNPPRLNSWAALVVSAAFVYSSSLIAQVPVVEASADSANAVNPSATATAETSANSADTGGVAQGEMFYQLQLLQQEVMQLRGIVEEQAYALKQVKEQNMERYIDLDRRLGEVLSNPAASAAGGATRAAPVNRQAVAVVALSGEKEAYDEAYGLVVNKRFDDALEAFKQFLMDFPGGRYAPNSYYWMGELYQVVKPQNLEASRQAFTQLLDQYPDHTKAADAMYKLGKVYFLKGNKEKSREWLDKVIARYSRGVNASADKARQFIKENF